MKKIMYLMLILALPGVVYAGVNYAFAHLDAPYIVTPANQERTASRQFYNYQLVWNEGIHKFELREGIQQRPITVEESLPLLDEQKPATQYYYPELAI